MTVSPNAFTFGSDDDPVVVDRSPIDVIGTIELRALLGNSCG